MLDDVYDADTHYYETPDCFTRFMPAGGMENAVRVEKRDGRQVVMAGRRPFTFIDDPFPGERVVKPGALKEMLRHLSEGLVADNPATAPMEPVYVERDARLVWMDKRGVTASALYPFVGICVEHFLKDDADALYDNLHSFNRWLEEEWGFGQDGRLFGVPLLSLLDPARATKELDRVLELGARIVSLRPGTFYGRSPADPVFDPFWARVSEAGAAVAFHSTESGYNERYSVDWGEDPNPSSHTQSALQWTCFFGDRPIMDTVAALIFANVFGRFPGVRVMSIENGALWVPYLLKAMDKMGAMARNGPWPGGRLTDRPSNVFRQHVYVSPFHEENVRGLIDLVGAERVLFGSDYPHPEGLAEPDEYIECLDGLADEVVDRVIRGNLKELLAT